MRTETDLESKEDTGNSDPESGRLNGLIRWLSRNTWCRIGMHRYKGTDISNWTDCIECGKHTPRSIIPPPPHRKKPNTKGLPLIMSDNKCEGCGRITVMKDGSGHSCCTNLLGAPKAMNTEEEERLKRIKGLQANIRMNLDKIDELKKGIENLAIEILKLKHSLKDLDQDE